MRIVIVLISWVALSVYAKCDFSQFTPKYSSETLLKKVTQHILAVQNWVWITKEEKGHSICEEIKSTPLFQDNETKNLKREKALILAKQIILIDKIFKVPVGIHMGILHRESLFCQNLPLKETGLRDVGLGQINIHTTKMLLGSSTAAKQYQKLMISAGVKALEISQVKTLLKKGDYQHDQIALKLIKDNNLLNLSMSAANLHLKMRESLKRIRRYEVYNSFTQDEFNHLKQVSKQVKSNWSLNTVSRLIDNNELYEKLQRLSNSNEFTYTYLKSKERKQVIQYYSDLNKVHSTDKKSCEYKKTIGSLTYNSSQNMYAYGFDINCIDIAYYQAENIEKLDNVLDRLLDISETRSVWFQTIPVRKDRPQNFEPAICKRLIQIMNDQ